MISPDAQGKGEYPPIDFDALCPFWGFFEHDGLNEEVVKLTSFIQSPVLLLGSGQGIVSEALGQIGVDVTNIDRSWCMREYAKRRRKIDTILETADTFRLCKKFNTIIVNTGVIDAVNIRTPFIEKMIASIKKHLHLSGTVLMAYFQHSKFIDECDKLKLFGEDCNNDLFFEGAGDLERVKQLLIGRGVDTGIINAVSKNNPDEIKKHMNLILKIGHRYVELYHESPAEFIRKYTGFYPYNLRRADEVHLRHLIEAEFSISGERAINRDTNVLILE